MWAVRLGKLVAVVVGLLFLAVLFWCRHALYNRFVRFPKEEAAWKRLSEDRVAVPRQGDWNDYRGVLHSHSLHSHDCEVSFEEILTALQQARVDFICLSDHCTEGRADFSLQWRGLHHGKLFIPGFEMREGLMPFGVRSGVVLSNATPPEVVARQVVQNGGVLFFAHPEEPRRWELPELAGMEIYNIHTAFKRYKPGLAGLLPELLLNLRRYPDHVVRLIFQRPDEFLRRWDELNRTRNITGIAGNDCHQNTGVRAIYTTNDTLRFEDTSPETIAEYPLNWFTRPVARLLFGRFEPGRKIFHFQLDPYDRMARYVSTHVLAADLSEDAVVDALRSGRVFVGFDLLADSSGFLWRARNGETKAVPGEALSLTDETVLEAQAPLPCRFTVLKHGELVHRTEGRSVVWKPAGPGKYRVEAELNVAGEWVPWVYANPILLR